MAVIIKRTVGQTLTTTDALDRLWGTVNERRTSTTQVKVTVEDLTNLLRDHATLSANTTELPMEK